MQSMHRFLRWNRARNGQIRFHNSDGAEIIGCLAKDISHSSATLLVHGDTQLIPIEIELSLDGIGSRSCRVKWRLYGRVGVEFDPDCLLDDPQIAA